MTSTKVFPEEGIVADAFTLARINRDLGLTGGDRLVYAVLGEGSPYLVNADKQTHPTTIVTKEGNKHE